MTPDAVLFLLIFATVGAIILYVGDNHLHKRACMIPPPLRLPPVYIAGPFAPWGGLSSFENTERAEAVARMYEGNRDIVCVHPGILTGEYGDDTIPAERLAGQERTLAECVNVALRGGILAVLQRSDGNYSSGTIEEIRAFVAVRPAAGSLHVWRWDDVANAPVRVKA